MSSAKADYEEFLKYRLEKNLKARENTAEPTGPESKPLGVIATSATDTFTGPERECRKNPVSAEKNSPVTEVEENKSSEDFRKEIKTDSELKGGKPEFANDVFDTDMQNREEERPSVLEVELFQHPFVTVTSNKPVPEESTAEFTVQVKIEIEESEIALQLPANKQASYRSSASSEEKKLTQNICLLEFVSGEMKPVSVAETSTDTLVEQTVTVEANRVEIEKSKGNVSDPSKENPEKLQIESFLLEDVEAKESKESRAQITMLKVDSALQKEREEIDLVVTETNVDPKKDNDFTNECQLCQFDTETVTMIEQLVDQRPRKAQLVKHFPDSGNSENKQRPLFRSPTKITEVLLVQLSSGRLVMEYKEKKNITFHENGTVSFLEYRFFHFEPDMSNGTENDHVLIPNLLLLGAAVMLEDVIAPVKIAASTAFSLFNQKAFLNRTVGEVLWGYEDPIVKTLNNIMPGMLPFGDKFGILVDFNNSHSGRFTVHTGVDDISKVHMVDTWNGLKKVSYWRSDQCNQINGTSGIIWPPFMTPSTSLELYSTDACRSMKLEFQEEAEFQRVPIYRYVAPKTLFANGTVYPPNEGFCPCRQSGIQNMSSCRL
ncbi:UNVERIFIED_CONTAM: hypothetical protein K2H54_010970, partial [Gekko kuhli]